MKLSVFAVLLQDRSFEDACKYLSSLGVQAVEIGCGGYPGKDHCDPEVLLHDEAKYQEFCDTIKKYDMEVSAFSCHGNPIHPNKELAAAYDKDMRNAVLMAEKYGLHQINCFSGCPGDCETSQYPNWVVCAWPDDFGKILEYQWKILVDYWKNFVAFAKEHGVNKIALEMHQGFCVYNTETLLKLREAVGPEIGANFDPSHLIWQGMDPVAVIRELGGDAIFHVHAKDTRLDKYNMAKNGALDTKSYADEAHRSWIFRSVGYGHSHQVWKDMMSALRLVGYDGMISIEHEDSLMTPTEGLEKAIAMLKDVMIFESKGEMWWA